MTAQLLPKGWRDLLRQIVLFCGAYWLYRLVRGKVDGQAGRRRSSTRATSSTLERALGLFVEPAVQAWAAGTGWVDRRRRAGCT